MAGGNGVAEYVGLTEQEFKYLNACRKQVQELTAFVADSTGSPTFINCVGEFVSRIGPSGMFFSG